MTGRKVSTELKKVKLFVQNKCPNCPPTKKLGKELKKEGISVELFNVKTPKGLTEGLMHNVLNTPSTIIVKKGEGVIKSYMGETPSLEEVKEWL